MSTKKFILRQDNGTIKSCQRCVDEPRYTYLKKEGEQVDFITHDKSQAKIFFEDSEVIVHSKDWQFIQIR